MAETDNSDSQKTAVDQIVIQALEDNDAEAIKSLFSVHAKSLCADLDKEIEYMFSIYEGEYVESTQHNYSSEKHSGDYETCIIYPVCVFKTTESYYKLTWNEWTINEKDKDKVGVYSMKLEVWPDAGLNQGGGDLPIAGIVYPDNSFANDIAKDLWKIIYQQEYIDNYIEEFRNLLSESLLASGITDDDIDRFLDCCKPMQKQKLDDGWIEFDEDKNITVYLLSNTDIPICVCFGLDKEQTDKISFLKIVEVGNEQTIGNYNLSEKNAGIYLPS
ncbi:MAG: DUF5104 domain-containing protein [Ruminococcus sp.]|nr:DUF5104 domain-containing protein [Ruminococcus sp.]